MAALALFSATAIAPPHVSAGGPDDSLSIVIRRRIAPEPGEVLVRARVEPDARSRELTIEWWTPEGFGGSHLITLEGERAATWHNYYIKGMEAGEYEVAAVLKRSDGSAMKRMLTVMVVGHSSPASSPSPFSATR